MHSAPTVVRADRGDRDRGGLLGELSQDLNEKLSAPRVEVERLRAILHNCRRHGPETQNRDGHADFRAHIRGRVAWIHTLDPAKGLQLRAMFDDIQWDAIEAR
jgi:hypothetical protein